MERASTGYLLSPTGALLCPTSDELIIFLRFSVMVEAGELRVDSPKYNFDFPGDFAKVFFSPSWMLTLLQHNARP